MSGLIVERRDQVRTSFLSLAAFMRSICTIKCVSMNGPFLVERAISISYLNALLRTTACGDLLASTPDDECIGPLVIACLVSARRLSPRRYRMTATRGLALAAAV